ncbi:MAG TPA: hypothetical protein VI933_00305 [archaeon]|nr:hypothetical protein [archaeon]
MSNKKIEEKVEEAKPKAGIGKKKIAILVLALIVIIIVGYMFIPAPTGEIILNEKNSEIYSLLVAGGINESMVDATAERVLIQYDLPEGMEKEASWYFVMGSAAAASPESEKVVAQAFVGENPTEKVSVKTKDVLDLLAGRINDAEFAGKVEVIS